MRKGLPLGEVRKGWRTRTLSPNCLRTIRIGSARSESFVTITEASQSLLKAFVAAQREAYADLRETAALKTMLPWLTRHLEDTRALMGEDFWPYGIEPNRHTLETFDELAAGLVACGKASGATKRLPGELRIHLRQELAEELGVAG